MEIQNPIRATKTPNLAQFDPLRHQIHPSEPEFGITLLDPALQSRLIPSPLRPWGGSRSSSAWRAAHFKEFSGTWHFYIADHKFAALLKHPEAPLKTNAPALVEPNFSLNPETPRWSVLEWTAKKRALARYWQSAGRSIFVDLNVPASHLADSLLGVPPGWGAYATRATDRDPASLAAQHTAALSRAGQTPLLMIVLGGGRQTRDYCAAHQLAWVPINLPGSDQTAN